MDRPSPGRGERPPGEQQDVLVELLIQDFYVQVERSTRPWLRCRPVAVQMWGDIIDTSAEARALGVQKHTMDPEFARTHFPEVTLVHVPWKRGLENDQPTMRPYRKASRDVFTVVRSFCETFQIEALNKVSS